MNRISFTDIKDLERALPTEGILHATGPHGPRSIIQIGEQVYPSPPSLLIEYSLLRIFNGAIGFKLGWGVFTDGFSNPIENRGEFLLTHIHLRTVNEDKERDCCGYVGISLRESGTSEHNQRSVIEFFPFEHPMCTRYYSHRLYPISRSFNFPNPRPDLLHYQ